MRTKLRSAIQQANQENARVVVAGGRMNHDGVEVSFSIDVQPVSSDGEDLLLICFVDEPKREHKPGRPATPRDASRIAELEQELEATRTELQGAIRNLEISSEEQKAINEEALSVNEEYQSTNEELLTSKEELQSLNEELTALNSQLQETLERQRTTSNDLQNVLYSTDVATLFLDTDLNIRFFTPATKSLFSVIPSDVGRPLADLNSLAADGASADRCKSGAADPRADRARDRSAERRLVQPSHIALSHPGQRGRRRRHHLCRHHRAEAFGGRTGGSQAASGSGQCSRNRAFSPRRATTCASRCKRSPCCRDCWPRSSRARERPETGRADRRDAGRHVGHAEHAARHQPDRAGTVRAEIVDFPINDLLDRLRDEFTYHAQAKGSPCASSRAAFRSTAIRVCWSR